jgi:hypothetical protein
VPAARRTLTCLIAVLALAVNLSGCDWKGEGKNVAAAIVATSQVKTRAFTGSLKFDGSKRAPAQNGQAQEPTSMTMTFSGAIDSTDAANPKMVMNMSAEGQNTSVVAPGDGKVYMTAGGTSFSVAVPPGQTAGRTIDPQKIYVALGDAVGDFQKAPPLTNAQGKSVTTISAKVGRSKLCGAVLDAFGEAMSQAGGLAGGLGGTTSRGGSDSKMLQNFCKMMLKSDPRVWFGIDNGRLTDVDLTAEIKVPLAGSMGIEVQYHEYNQDRPQTGFDPPADATPLSSFDALRSSATS